MSERIVNLVRHHSKATKTAKFVLLVYAFYAHDDGSGACPSPSHVAEEIGITTRAVYQHLKELEAMGEIRHDGKSPVYKTPSYTVLPNVSRTAVPASQTVKPASMDSVCLSVPESIPGGVEIDNRQTEYREASFTNREAGFTNTDPPEVEALVNDLAEYDVTGSHVVGWARRIVERPQWQAEVANILDYWDANEKLGEGWLAQRVKELAFMSRHTPRRALRVVKGGGDRAAPEDEFEAIRRAYGGYQQAYQEASHA
ncbi:MAG: helix-turn-helix domain-containing protein [Candidatus Promineofilum sp.]|nr:helix-turn-helix domain-containing protein [Promineifilum sp.]